MDPVEALLKKAQKFLQSAAVLLELEDFDSTASRAYFAMFYAAQALLMREQQGTFTRQGIRSAFVETYVNTGRLPGRAGQALNRAAELQEVGDYSNQFAVSREEAEWVLQEAEAFVNSISRMAARPARVNVNRP